MLVCCGKKQKKSQIGTDPSMGSSDMRQSEEVGDENKMNVSNINGKRKLV